MPRYMLLMYQPADGSGQPATKEGWAEAQTRWQGYLKDLTDAGLLVANEGLGALIACESFRCFRRLPRSSARSEPRTRSSAFPTNAISPRRSATARS